MIPTSGNGAATYDNQIYSETYSAPYSGTYNGSMSNVAQESLEAQIDSPSKGIPANVDAERAVLGAIMIDPDAIIKVANFLRAEDFFRERHKWLYETMLALNERREPLDFVTLVDELERREQLEEVGGPAYINELVSSTPTAMYVDHYARIVERTALLRRLISVAGKIAEMAYDESQEVDQVVDKAEQLVFGVSESRIHRDLTPIRAIMHNVVDRIETLVRSPEALMGVPTGFTDLDKMLGGFQRSDLIILAARPGMGKTSFVTSIAQNATKQYNARIGIFSLEMSNEQLVQRMLAMETEIDSYRLRLGDVRSEEEWATLMEGANRLSSYNIFIDDTPAASVNDIRTKSRRLYAEHGLDMIIIDYMQLMSGQSQGRNENRQQEISYISRSLKGLARELNVPVIALSQLSRAVESRADKRPMLSDLRESGCLSGDTLVYLPDLGIYRPIRELEGQSGFNILAVNTDTWRLETAPVSRAFKTGTKQVHRLTTKLGRTVRATANHKFLTIEGWKRLDELQPDDLIALPRQLDGPTQQTMTNDELALLGHMIGDGCTLPRHAIQYTTREFDLAEVVDVIPNDIWRMYAVPSMVREKITTRQMQAQLGNAYCGTQLYKQNVSRERAGRLAQVMNSKDIEHLATSDIYWDKIESIDADGLEDVYDLTVPGNHNFVANNIIVHNSIEQDADVVMFIYREDYYIEDTDRQNITDILVTKHRHGSTGTVSLFFRKELTQFSDLEIQRTDLDY